MNVPELEIAGLPQAIERRSAFPFIKWAGGKGHLLSEIMRYVPRDFSGDYYEPFLGGGAVFFALYRTGHSFKAYLSDTNEELINCYEMVKNRPADLLVLLKILQQQFHDATNKEVYFYNVRSLTPTSGLQAAARFIFLNKTCYNGLYRVNKKGVFNVPFGGYRKPNIVNESKLFSGSKALNESKSKLSVLDYKKSIDRCQSGDLVYLDPPYHPTSKTAAFTDYTTQGFTELDQRNLRDSFVSLAERGCKVVLTNSDTGLVRTLYDDFRRKRLLVSRPISCKGSGRKGFHELLVSNVPRIDTQISDFV